MFGRIGALQAIGRASCLLVVAVLLASAGPAIGDHGVPSGCAAGCQATQLRVVQLPADGFSTVELGCSGYDWSILGDNLGCAISEGVLVAGRRTGTITLMGDPTTQGLCPAYRTIEVVCAPPPDAPPSPPCDGTACGPGAGRAWLGRGPRVEMGLGTGLDGESAGRLRIDWLEAGTAVKALAVLVTDGVAVVPNNEDDATVRQLRAPQCLVHLDYDTSGDSDYDIKYYREPLGGWVLDQNTGWYIIDGLVPFVRWHIYEATNGPPFVVRKYVNPDGTGETLEVVYTFTLTVLTQEDDWELQISDVEGPPPPADRIETEVLPHDGQQDVRTIEVTQDGVTQTTVETWRSGYGDKVITSRSVYADATHTLTTTYWYHDEDPYMPHDNGTLWKQKNPDGSWVAYRYDTFGRLAAEISSWGDTDLPPSPEVGQIGNRSQQFSYDGDDDRRPASITERIGSTIVARTDYTYTFDGSGNEVTIERRAADPGVNPPVTYLQTKITRKPDGEKRLLSVEYPDGRLDTYAYEEGTYTFSPTDPTFEVQTSGDCTRRKTIHQTGTPANPVSIPNKTTMETLVLSAEGRPVLEETYVYAGSAFVRVAWTAREHDDYGRPTYVYQSNGTYAHTEWSCCYPLLRTDETGTTTTYTYDDIGRLLSETKAGMNGADDITTSYSRAADPVGWKETVAVQHGTEALTSVSQYDLAGRLRFTIDEAGLVTEHQYDDTDGARTETTIAPDGGETVTEYLRDGRVSHVSGSAAIEQTYSYGVGIDGSGNPTQWTRVFTGAAGTDSPRWARTTTDALGRVVSEDDPASFPQATSYYYNSLGQLTRVQKPSQGDTLYEYDELGSVRYTALDIANPGTIDLAGTDRVTHSETTYESADNAWWRVTRTWIYPNDNDASPKLTQSQWTRLTGFPTNITSERRIEDVYGNVTVVRTELSRAAALVTERTDYEYDPAAGFVTDELRSTRNKLLEQTVSRTGVTLTYGYDGFGRQESVLDARTDPSAPTVTHYNDAGQVEWVENPQGDRTTYEYYVNGVAGAGKIKSVANPAEKKTYYAYTPRGEVWRVWGHVPQPIEYGYDDNYGERTSLSTYRGGTGWSNENWPDGSTGTADTTTWIYHEATGLLWYKTDAEGEYVEYEYDSARRLTARVWARGASTSYTYYWKTGEVTKREYSDELTPTVDLTYTRFGAVRTVTDATGQRTLNYNDDLQLQSEEISGSLFLQPMTVATQYEDGSNGTVPGRFAGTSATKGGVQTYAAAYSYYPDGRMKRVTGPGLPTGTGTDFGVRYTYHAASDLVHEVQFRNGQDVLVRTERAYEGQRDLLNYVENDWDPGGTPVIVSRYDYANDVRARRTGITYSGVAFTSPPIAHTLEYDDRNELISFSRSGTSWGYLYDNIGNRTWSRMWDDPSDPNQTYTPSALNQYAQVRLRSTPEQFQSYEYDEDGNLTNVWVAADMNCDGAANFGDVNPFVQAVSDPAAWHAAYPDCNILNGDINGDGTTNMGDINPLVALLTSGNSGVSRTYTWDGENRLIQVEPTGGTTIAEGAQKVEFAYDYLGRRVRKLVWTWQNGQWNLTAHRKFVWSGWRMLLEINEDNNVDQVLRKYTWGLDLAGQNGNVNSLEAAGTIGGLVAIEAPPQVRDVVNYLYLYDGNGNVGQMVEWQPDLTDPPGTWVSQRLVAHYEYDPYGNITAQSGSYADSNPIRFGTKYRDAETGLSYFGYRYYAPGLGRWLNRDPIEEEGGENLCAYVRNNPGGAIDPIGQADTCKLKWRHHTIHVGITWYVNDAYRGDLDYGYPSWIGSCRSNLKAPLGYDQGRITSSDKRAVPMCFCNCFSGQFRQSNSQRMRYGMCCGYFVLGWGICRAHDSYGRLYFDACSNSNSGIHAAVRLCERQCQLSLFRPWFANDITAPGWSNISLSFSDSNNCRK